MTHVTVLSGGASDEREVSLRSGTSIMKALQSAGYETSWVDPVDLGEEALIQQLSRADVVFPVLHGIGGEDGTIQSIMELHDITYIGTDAKASVVCFDKWSYKKALQSLIVRTPAGELVNAESFESSAYTEVPYVLKPTDGGSSVDTFVVRDPASADKEAIDLAFKKHDRMLIEELISGTEITVGVLGTAALPPVEIVPPENGEFDYENKYNGQTTEYCPARSVAPEVLQQAMELAEKIHIALGLRDMSRTDMIIRREDDRIFVLETNTIPGMTDQSLLPKEAAAAGYSMEAFVRSLVEAALDRKNTPVK